MSGPGPVVLITGGLGGLGGAVGRALLARGARVVVLDNMDPGTAPSVHHKHSLSMFSDNDCFAWIPGDTRSPDWAALAAPFGAPELLLHVAGPGPWRPEPRNPVLDAALGPEAARDLMRQGREQGLRAGLIPTWDPTGAASLRERPGWRETFRTSDDLVSMFSEAEDVVTAPLPVLWGPGQAPPSPPLHVLLRLVSREPLTAPEPARQERFAWLPKAAEVLADTLLSADGHTPPPPPRIPADRLYPRDLMNMFIEESGITEPEVADGDPWGPQALGDEPLLEGEALRERVRTMVAWAATLPWLPPMNWPTTVRDRIDRAERRKWRKLQAKRRKQEKP